MNSVVSLFCGCGGVDLGTLGGFNFNKRKYEPHPCKLVYACDIDQKAVDSHKLNFGSEGAVCADICEVDERDIPECDILTGGFPCQSFSTVNPTKDPFDDRANLYKQMVRIVKAKQPKVFVAENVKGMMTLHKGTIFKRVITSFEEAGYKTFYSLLNLKSSVSYYQRQYFNASSAMERLQERYDRLKEKCQPFLQALEHFPKLVEAFVEKVKELFSIKEAQERKEREDRAAGRKEQSKHRRGRNDWER